tara:strand:- start:46591 stop:46869 length:279 start_codon:yes stop_codon:yes gene_type:complete
MLLIPCPWCGLRAESEFSSGGEANISRPYVNNDLSDNDWADYLFYRKNPKGWHQEQWHHVKGCRRWFNVERHTVTHEIRKSWPMNSSSDSND